jgi:hypothetical protein
MFDSLQGRLDQLAVEQRNLKKSQELMQHWPDIFDKGKARAGPVSPSGEIIITLVRLTNGAGETRDIPVDRLDKDGHLYKQCLEQTPNPHIFKQRFRGAR